MDDRRFRGQRALRRGRVSIPGQIYHVTTATHDRTPLFADFSRGRVVVNALREAECAGAKTLAFCVMPDHFHWLLQLGEQTSGAVVCRVKGRSATRLNRLEGFAHPVWQRAYFDRAIRRDDDLEVVARYIIENPLRKGLVTRVGDYPLWDSIWLPP